MKFVLVIAGLLSFLVAIIFAFFVDTYGTDAILGWVAVGLACWIASTVAPANLG